MNKLKTILSDLPLDPWCKYAAESGDRLTKIALNALEARNMAKSVGLQPTGNWKWALRNMRDGQGNVLQGRELASAKEGMGKMPNNLRQTLNSSARQTGMSTEIGTHIDKINGKLSYEGKAPSLKYNSPYTHLTGDNKGNEEAYHETMNLFKGKGISPEFKNSLYSEYMTNSLKGDFRVGAINVGTPNRVSAENPYRDGFSEVAGIHTHPFSGAKKYSKNEEVQRIGSKGWQLTTPSGMIGYNKNPKDLKSLEHSDMNSIMGNTNSNHVIYDPVYGNEGIHKMRPQGLRSIYFKNQGLYD